MVKLSQKEGLRSILNKIEIEQMSIVILPQKEDFEEERNEIEKTITLKDEYVSYINNDTVIELGIETSVTPFDEDVPSNEFNLDTRVFMCCYGIYGSKREPYLSFLMHTAKSKGKSVVTFPYSKKQPKMALKSHSLMAFEEFFGEKKVSLTGYIKFENDYYVFGRIQKPYNIHLKSDHWYNVLPTEIVNHEKCVNMGVYKNIVRLFLEYSKLSLIIRLSGELYLKNVLPFPIYKVILNENENETNKDNVYELMVKPEMNNGIIQRYVCHLADKLHIPIYKQGENENQSNVLWEKFGLYMIDGDKVIVNDPTINLHHMSDTKI